MLVHEHARGDAARVEAVQEVLDVLVGDGVHAEGLLVLHHALSHGGHHVVVPVTHGHQGLCETAAKTRRVRCTRQYIPKHLEGITFVTGFGRVGEKKVNKVRLI